MLPTAYRVVDKRRELADTWTLEIEPAGAEGVGAFEPGQFSMLYAFGAGEVPISVSGGGDGGGPLVHTVRAVGAAT
ncbi:MAG: Ni/Fe hydrogenase subunit gamma, partial [Solirubrobacterales bacterium]